MRENLLFKRVLLLTAIVLLLSAMYVLVRMDVIRIFSGVSNPAIAEAIAGAAPQGADARPLEEGYLVIWDPEDPVSKSVRPAIDMALGCIGLQAEYLENPSADRIRSETRGIIVALADLDEIGRMSDLLAYAEEGGNLIFSIRPEVNGAFLNIYQQLGIYEHHFFEQSEGFHLREGYLTQDAFDVEGEWIENSIIALHVTDNCDIIASNDDGVPLIWTQAYGRGKILFMNNSLMVYKATGGLFLSLLGDMENGLFYPVINARALALNAFPLPMDVNNDYMRNTYMRSAISFMRDVWWPDMVRFTRTSGIPLTCTFMTALDAEDDVLDMQVVNANMALSYFVQEINRYGGEVGFAGYNQKPLYFGETPEGLQYELWSSRDKAAIRTEEAVAAFRAFFPDYPLLTYIPPDGYMDADGRDIIFDNLPDLRVICGNYYEEGRLYQDFGVESDGIVTMPVVSAGLNNSPYEAWKLINVASAKGIVFHSVSVDDFLLASGPEHDWQLLSQAFETFLADTVRTTDYLDNLICANAAERVRQYASLAPQVQWEAGALTVTEENPQEEAYYMLICPRGMEPTAPEGVELTHLGGARYFVKAGDKSYRIEMRAQ